MEKPFDNIPKKSHLAEDSNGNLKMMVFCDAISVQQNIQHYSTQECLTTVFPIEKESKKGCSVVFFLRLCYPYHIIKT